MQRKSLVTFLTLTLVFTLLSLNASTLTKAATSHLVISEIQIDGTTANEDFVELYNPTDSPIDLNGHRLVKRSSAGVSDDSIKSWTSETIIPANSYYLWANSSWTPAVAPDASGSATLAANNGVALRFGAEDTGTIVDSVAWGTATNAFVETAPFATNPVDGASMERVGDDTDNNSLDFVLREVSDPQNSASVTASPTATPTSTPTATPEPSISPSVEPSPTIVPTVTPTISPTSTPAPTPSATATPVATVRPGKILAHFGNRECRMVVRVRRFGFMMVPFPTVVCTRLGN